MRHSGRRPAEPLSHNHQEVLTLFRPFGLNRRNSANRSAPCAFAPVFFPSFPLNVLPPFVRSAEQSLKERARLAFALSRLR
jgi:hypothetical protein